mmetsp:Transcript_12580/g.15621  ORF Transcript_12580/g.15621 Transcript_12580/m.15621 type:complete len:149 (+) Transcript_12580:343-789(+)
MSKAIAEIDSLLNKLDTNKNDSNKNGFKFGDKLTFENVRQLMYKFVDERDWHQYHQPRNILLALVGEVGELSEIFQWKGECKVGLKNWNNKDLTHLGEEISDVLLYLIRLSDVCNIDITKAVLNKMKKNELKYPAKLVKGKSKKYNEY